MGPEGTSTDQFPVFLIGSADRDAAIRTLFGACRPRRPLRQECGLKANFTAPMPFRLHSPGHSPGPGDAAEGGGPREITLVERSGMGDTRRCPGESGHLPLCEQLGAVVWSWTTSPFRGGPASSGARPIG